MHLHLHHITKPIEDIETQSGLSGADDDDVAQGFSYLVENSQSSQSGGDVTQGIHAAAHTYHPFLHKFVPQLQTLANKYHVGNFVIDRKTGEKFFESMPIYARLGMHLLFRGREQVKLLEGSKRVEDLLREQSVREGRIYDSPESVKNIPSFINTYKIALDELLDPDIQHYATFNEFFHRKLKPDARPVENADDPAGFCSAADCRLVAYPSVNLARKFWIKGDEFSVPALLNLDPSDPSCLQFDGGSLAIFRLAPSDYHRFHSPIDATVLGNATDVPGQYYTGQRMFLVHVHDQCSDSSVRSEPPSDQPNQSRRLDPQQTLRPFLATHPLRKADCLCRHRRLARRKHRLDGRGEPSYRI
jgi:phosphatidylserine decarboxylase